MASLSNTNRAVAPTSGRELILELKRTTHHVDNNNAELAPYNAQLVRKCFQDVQKSFQSLREEMQAVQQMQAESKTQDSEDEEEDDNTKKPSMNARPSILFHNACIQRQKRCLLTYHKHRMDRIQQIVVANSHTSTTGQDSDKWLQHNNVHEAEFAHDYQQLREQYASEFFELNLLPPTSHMVQVKVVEDLYQQLGGPVVLDSGRSVSLHKGSRWYLPRSDVLEYLQAGSMELADGEEVDF